MSLRFSLSLPCLGTSRPFDTIDGLTILLRMRIEAREVQEG